MLYLKRWVNNEYRVGDKTKDINQARPIREKSEKKLLNGGGGDGSHVMWPGKEIYTAFVFGNRECAEWNMKHETRCNNILDLLP